MWRNPVAVWDWKDLIQWGSLRLSRPEPRVIITEFSSIWGSNFERPTFRRSTYEVPSTLKPTSLARFLSERQLEFSMYRKAQQAMESEDCAWVKMRVIMGISNIGIWGIGNSPTAEHRLGACAAYVLPKLLQERDIDKQREQSIRLDRTVDLKLFWSEKTLRKHFWANGIDLMQSTCKMQPESLFLAFLWWRVLSDCKQELKTFTFLLLFY